MESCSLVVSQILDELPSREHDIGNHTKLCKIITPNYGLSKSAQTFPVGFLYLLSTHPIHVVVWRNFSFHKQIYNVLHMDPQTSSYLQCTFHTDNNH